MWKRVGEWDVKNVKGPVAMKTLTNLTPYENYPIELIELIDEKESIVESRNIFWLNANTKIWSFSELNIGENIEYTAVNENGV